MMPGGNVNAQVSPSRDDGTLGFSTGQNTVNPDEQEVIEGKVVKLK